MRTATAVITDKDWINLPFDFLVGAIQGPFADERFERRDGEWCVVWTKGDEGAVPLDARGAACCERALDLMRADAIWIVGDGPHHGYVNTDAAHMPEGVNERLRWDARLRERGERDES